MNAGAVISQDKLYRYALWREFGPGDFHAVLYIGLNPSTADGDVEYATTRRLMSFAESWGFGSYYLGNVFAYRSTSPKALKTVDDPFGPENDEWLKRMAKKATMIICCWGAHSMAGGAEVWIRALLPGRKLHCLSKTKDGSPGHPLYLSKHTKPMEF